MKRWHSSWIATTGGRASAGHRVPALVAAEVTYLVGRRLGPGAEAAFLRAFASVEVEAPLAEEWASIAELVGCAPDRTIEPMAPR